MGSILITSDKKKELILLAEVAKKMGLGVAYFEREQLEDSALLKAMEESRKGDLVSEEEVMKLLQS